MSGEISQDSASVLMSPPCGEGRTVGWRGRGGRRSRRCGCRRCGCRSGTNERGRERRRGPGRCRSGREPAGWRRSGGRHGGTAWMGGLRWRRRRRTRRGWFRRWRGRVRRHDGRHGRAATTCPTSPRSSSSSTIRAPSSRAPVVIGLSDWDYVEVLAGLEVGEELALIGAAQLQARQQAPGRADAATHAAFLITLTTLHRS